MAYPIKRKNTLPVAVMRRCAGCDHSGLADETSLNDTAAAYSAMTGSDGTKISLLPARIPMAQKTSLTAALYSDTTKKATDTIFKPLSPARTAIRRKCGGHMPETVIYRWNGLLKRPLLLKELSKVRRAEQRLQKIMRTGRNLPKLRRQAISSNGCGSEYVLPVPGWSHCMKPTAAMR
ncbi:hypothetical protein MJ590_12925 [Escherichia coli]|nr:hypothetical protein MJ590_12925 [Escherichia coli]